MAKLSAKQIHEIGNMIQTIGRIQVFINDPQTIIARRKSKATTTLDFNLTDVTTACTIAKDIGSKLAMLSTLKRSLALFAGMPTT